MRPQETGSGSTADWLPEELRQESNETSTSVREEWAELVPDDLPPGPEPFPDEQEFRDLALPPDAAGDTAEGEHAPATAKRGGPPAGDAAPQPPPRGRLARELRAKFMRLSSSPEGSSSAEVRDQERLGQLLDQIEALLATRDPDLSAQMDSVRRRVELELAAFAKTVEGVDASLRSTQTRMGETVQRSLGEIERAVAACEASIHVLVTELDSRTRELNERLALLERRPGAGPPRS